jgi:hypothetical protein
MYVIGVLPSLLVFWIRRGMPESGRWEATSERRRAAQAQRRSGALLEGENAALTRFTIVDMFLDRDVRGRLIPTFLMMLSVTFALGSGVSPPSCRPMSARSPPRRACRRRIIPR